MTVDPLISRSADSQTDYFLRRLLASMSIFTLLMTLPQVWMIWVNQQASGVSVLSWSAYFLSAILWFWHGLRQGDKNIYWPCVAWMALNGAVVVGAVVYG